MYKNGFIFIVLLLLFYSGQIHCAAVFNSSVCFCRVVFSEHRFCLPSNKQQIATVFNKPPCHRWGKFSSNKMYSACFPTVITMWWRDKIFEFSLGLFAIPGCRLVSRLDRAKLTLARLISDRSLLPKMSFQESSRAADEDEAFYVQCRASYLSVFRSSLTNITSRQQLCRGKTT